MSSITTRNRRGCSASAFERSACNFSTLSSCWINPPSHSMAPPATSRKLPLFYTASPIEGGMCRSPCTARQKAHRLADGRGCFIRQDADVLWNSTLASRLVPRRSANSRQRLVISSTITTPQRRALPGRIGPYPPAVLEDPQDVEPCLQADSGADRLLGNQHQAISRPQCPCSCAVVFTK